MPTSAPPSPPPHGLVMCTEEALSIFFCFCCIPPFILHKCIKVYNLYICCCHFRQNLKKQYVKGTSNKYLWLPWISEKIFSSSLFCSYCGRGGPIFLSERIESNPESSRRVHRSLTELKPTLKWGQRGLWLIPAFNPTLSWLLLSYRIYEFGYCCDCLDCNQVNYNLHIQY